MNADRYREHIRTTKTIVESSDLQYLPYKEAAFGIILKHLIDSDQSSTPEFDEAVDQAVEKRIADAREARADRD